MYYTIVIKWEIRIRAVIAYLYPPGRVGKIGGFGNGSKDATVWWLTKHIFTPKLDFFLIMLKCQI